MTIIKMLTLDDVRPEARRSVEAWALKADPKRKKSFYRFFESGPEGASRGSVATSHGGEQMTTMEDAEKELEMRNWASSYQTTNNSLGNVLEQMRKRQQSGSERILRPLVREVHSRRLEPDHARNHWYSCCAAVVRRRAACPMLVVFTVRPRKRDADSLPLLESWRTG
jgi:hypothetical protein